MGTAEALICEGTEPSPPSPGGERPPGFHSWGQECLPEEETAILPSARCWQNAEVRIMGLGAVLEGLQICPVESKASMNMESDDLFFRHWQQMPVLAKGPGLRRLGGRWEIADPILGFPNTEEYSRGPQGTTHMSTEV